MVALRVWRDGAPSRGFGGNGWLTLFGWTQRQSTVDRSEGWAMGSGIKCGHVQYGRHVQDGYQGGCQGGMDIKAGWFTESSRIYRGRWRVCPATIIFLNVWSACSDGGGSGGYTVAYSKQDGFNGQVRPGQVPCGTRRGLVLGSCLRWREDPRGSQVSCGVVGRWDASDAASPRRGLVYGATNVRGATRRRQTLAADEQQEWTEGGCSLLLAGLLAHTWALHIPGRHPCRPFLIGVRCRRPLPPAFICPTRAATERPANTS
jgi:hypothetical protein